MPIKRAVKKPPSGESRAAEGMGGLAKGLAIIEALSSRGVQSAADAARASHSTRAAARRCLLTLVELGYVERIGREFRPLAKLRNLGRGNNSRQILIDESTPILARARDTLNESVSLAVLDGNSALFIARAEAEHIISTGVRVGARLPAYCSATGRVLLSQFSDDDIRAAIRATSLAQLTAKTLTKSSLILREIHAVRVAGFAVSNEEIALGMRSLAVPVRDADGAIAAALSVSAFSARVSRKELLDHFLPVLQECAAQLAERCYGRRP
jgi:IclR family pca regulon transcriptional regulator